MARMYGQRSVGCDRSDSRMHIWVTAIVSLLTPLQFACTWIRASSPPQYQSPNPLPLTVGVQISDSLASRQDGPVVIKLLDEMKIFKSMIYPYRADDVVDGVLFLSIDGKWRAQDGLNFWSSVFLGLSLFTLSPIVGVNMVGTYSTEATLSDGPKNISHVAVRTVSRISWGVLASTEEVTDKANDLQWRSIAVELSHAIEEDRNRILAEYSERVPPAQAAPRLQEQTGQGQPESTDAPGVTRSVAGELERLADLRKRGLISEGEFAKAKARVLGD